MTTTTQPTDRDADGFDQRDERAATEPMITVRAAPDFYQVHTGEDAVYHVDARAGVCDCDDFHWRAPEGGCKHVRRINMERGEQPIPPADDLDELLAYRRLDDRYGSDGETQ